jgi:ubiquinone/menaquinone biosynthesis C-methylase UbiE
MKTFDPPADTAAPGAPSAPAATSWTRRVAVGTQRRRWDSHADAYEGHTVVGLEKVIDAVVTQAGEAPLGVVVDAGCGGGALTMRLAGAAEKVVAVDISTAMLDKLQARAGAAGLHNVEARCEPLESLELPAASVDVVVTNYALHHLLDRDKEQFVRHAATWLRPGGRLVIGDMMIGRRLSAEDRQIISGKVKVLIRRGPGGWWRVAKNAWRLYTRTVERPLSAEAWTEMLRRAGFEDVRSERVVSEAAVVCGTRPGFGDIDPSL